jgi:cytochrome c-type biogenesis protein
VPLLREADERVGVGSTNRRPAPSVRSLLAAFGGGGSGPLLYAFTLGLVAAVNPCGFPLLPAYLTFFVGDADADRSRQTLRGLVTGVSVTGGFLVVFGLCGLLVDSGVDLVLGWVPWVMVPVGLTMAAIGTGAAIGHPLRISLPIRRVGSGRGPVAMAGFGVAYAVASLTCALPLFLAAVASSFGRFGPLRGLGTAIAYALGMGLLLTVAGLVVANIGVAPLRRLGGLSRALPRLAGGVLALVGAYLAFYWAVDLAAPTSTPEPIGLVEHLQTTVSNWLSSSPRLVGAALGLVLVVTLVLLAGPRRDRRRPSAQSTTTPEPTPISERVGG